MMLKEQHSTPDNHDYGSKPAPARRDVSPSRTRFQCHEKLHLHWGGGPPVEAVLLEVGYFDVTVALATGERRPEPNVMVELKASGVDGRFGEAAGWGIVSYCDGDRLCLLTDPGNPLVFAVRQSICGGS